MQRFRPTQSFPSRFISDKKRARCIAAVTALPLVLAAGLLLPVQGLAQQTGAAAEMGSIGNGGSTGIANANALLAPVMPSGVVFVYDINGQVSARRGQQSVSLERYDSLRAADPLSFELPRDSSLGLVLSNGIGLWVKGPARFTIKKFDQRPFEGNSRQTAYEPTQSALDIELERGTFAFNERNLSALSTVRFHFGEGSVLDAHEAASLLLQIGTGASGSSDRISLLNGRALLHYGGHASALLIGSGQYIELDRSGTTLRLPSQLTTDQLLSDQTITNHAFLINERLWFFSENNEPLPRAQVIIPENLWLSKPHSPTRIR